MPGFQQNTIMGDMEEDDEEYYDEEEEMKRRDEKQEKIPEEYIQPSCLSEAACKPGWFARFLIQAHDGKPNKIQLAARVARRVLEMLEHDLQNACADSFVDACATGEIQHVIEYLKAGKDVDAPHSVLGYCGIHAACDFNQIEIVKLLIKHGADFQVERRFGKNTPLHCAAENGHLKLTKYLVFDVGADITRKNIKGLLPFNLAYEQRHSAVADVLRQPPEPVTDLEYIYESLGCRSVQLKWSHPSDNGTEIDSYDIQITPTKGVELKLNPTASGFSKSVRKADGSFNTYCFKESLTPATTYSVFIRAHNASGWSEEGEELKFETLPDIPETPGRPFLAKTGSTCISIDLEWTAPYNNNGEIIYLYELQMMGPFAEESKSNTEDWKTVDLISGKEVAVETKESGNYRREIQFPILRFTAEGLEANKGYVFRVKAKNKVGWSSFTASSNMISTRPPVKAINIASKQIVVEWSEMIDYSMEGNVSYWELQRTKPPYSGCNNYDWRTAEWVTVSEDVVGEMTEYTIRDLSAATMYYTRVRPYLQTEDRFLNWNKCAVSVGIVTMEATPEEPSAPLFDNITHNSVVLSWKFPRDNGNSIDKFSLRCCKISVGTWTTIAPKISACEKDVEKTDGLYSYPVNNLDQGSEYIFSIRAHNEIGWSTYSAVSGMVRTRTCAPPTPPRLVCKTDSMLQVEWTVPLNFIDQIKTYEIQILRCFDEEDEDENKTHEWKSLDDKFFMDHCSNHASARAEDLIPVSCYMFRVRAQTPDDDWTNFSPPGGPFKTNRRF